MKKPSTSLENFAHWLLSNRRRSAREIDRRVLDSARQARDQYQKGFEEASTDLRSVSVVFERIELMAAADTTEDRLLPRMRTPRGFSISPIYRLGAAPGEAPAYLLIECPADLARLVEGETACFFVAGRRIELGQFDADGKVTGALPASIELKPPFGFSVGELTEVPQHDPDPT